MIAMTCSYPESGLSGLIPLGFVVYGDCHAEYKPKNRLVALENLRKNADGGATHVFNVRFEEKRYGHPDNYEFSCLASGDAYGPKGVDQ